MIPGGSVLSPQNLKLNQLSSHYNKSLSDMFHYYAATYNYDSEVNSFYVSLLQKCYTGFPMHTSCSSHTQEVASEKWRVNMSFIHSAISSCPTDTSGIITLHVSS
jgi:hypothetical protein